MDKDLGWLNADCSSLGMQSLVHAIFSVKKAIPVVYSSVHICIAGLKIIGSVCSSVKLVKKGNNKGTCL